MRKYTKAAHYDYYEGVWDDESYTPLEEANYLALRVVEAEEVYS